MNKSSLALAALLVAATVLVYLPVLSGGFIAYDDPDTVLDNSHVGDASPGGLANIFTDRIFLTWLSLYFLSLWTDHLLFGLEPFGYHLTNLLLHLLNAFVVLVLARRITGRRDVAWGAAFLFALHPAMTESVAWISERKGLLAFLFAGLSFLEFLRAAEAVGWRRVRRHLAGALLLGLAMLAKGSALVLPAILLLFVAALRWKERRALWLAELAPYFAVAGVLASVHYAIAVDEGPALAGGGHGTATLLLTAPAVLAEYSRLLVLPFWGQSLVRDYQVASGPTDPRAVVGAVFVVAAAFALVISWRRDRRLFFALAAALAGLAPFNNVFPRTTVLFAERYLYLPALGGCLLLAILAAKVRRRAWIPLGALVLLFGGFAAARARVWGDGVEIFKDAEAKAAASWLASMKHGEAIAFASRPTSWPDAAAAFARAVERAGSPIEELRARADLAGALLAGPDGAEPAIASLATAEGLLASLSPAEAASLAVSVHLNRGVALAALGRDEEAVAAYRAAAQADPGGALALAGLCSSLARTGDLPGALEAGREAFRLDRGDGSAAVSLAEVELLSGNPGAARQVLSDHLQADPRSVRALCLLGELELLAGRPVPGRLRFAAALEASPGLKRAILGICEADLLMARGAKARGDLDTARELARMAAGRMPADPGPWVFLAGLATDAAEAERLLERAASLPGGERARVALGSLRVRGALARADQGDEAVAAALIGRAIATGCSSLRLSTKYEVKTLLPALREVPAGAPGRGPLMVGLARFLGGEHAAAELLLARAYREAVEAGSGGDLAYLALSLRGRARLSRDDLGGALDDFQVVSEMRPKDPWPVLRIAETLFTGAVKEKNRAIGSGEVEDMDLLFAGAREAALRALALAPELMEAELRLGEIEFASGSYLESLKIFTRVKRKHPGRVEPMLDLASLYRTHFLISEDRKYLKEAEKELRKAIRMDPGDARVRAVMGEVLLLAGQTTRAAGELARAVAEDPTLTDARDALAGLYVRAGRTRLGRGGGDALEKAGEFAQRALALDTRSAGPHLLLAEIAVRARDFSPAQVHLDRARLLDPESKEVNDAFASFHKDLGYRLLLAGKKDRAMEEFKKAVEAGSENVELRQVRVLLGLEEPEDAGEPLDPRVAELLAERTREAKRWFDEARRLRRDGKPDEALEAAKSSLAARLSGECYFLVGLIHSDRDAEDLAEKAYRSAVRVKPSLAGAWLNLGSLLFRRGDDEGALGAYRRYLQSPGDEAMQAMRDKVEQLVKELRERLDDR